MSWRTVVISNRCKIDFCLGFVVVRGEETKRIFADEISILIIENIAVSLTACVICELIKRKVKIIFCDDKRNPQSELFSLYGSHDNSVKIKKQLEWDRGVIERVWIEILKNKIRNQSLLLKHIGDVDNSRVLDGYIDDIEGVDITNREGHAAKVYFNSLFGMNFTRDSNSFINAALNYGYSFILSAINREIVSCGYLTQIGLAHDNMYNHFNLSCDLMEPYRIVVDAFVRKNSWNGFGTPEKHKIYEIVSVCVLIDSNKQTLLNAIRIYVKSVLDALNDNNPSFIKFPILDFNEL